MKKNKERECCVSKKKKQTFRATEREEREREEKKRWNYRKKQRGRDMIDQTKRESHIHAPAAERKPGERGERRKGRSEDSPCAAPGPSGGESIVSLCSPGCIRGLPSPLPAPFATVTLGPRGRHLSQGYWDRVERSKTRGRFCGEGWKLVSWRESSRAAVSAKENKDRVG